jgi:hypothetical protein
VLSSALIHGSKWPKTDPGYAGEMVQASNSSMRTSLGGSMRPWESSGERGRGFPESSYER